MLRLTHSLCYRLSSLWQTYRLCNRLYYRLCSRHRCRLALSFNCFTYLRSQRVKVCIIGTQLCFGDNFFYGASILFVFEGINLLLLILFNVSSEPVSLLSSQRFWLIIRIHCDSMALGTGDEAVSYFIVHNSYQIT